MHIFSWTLFSVPHPQNSNESTEILNCNYSQTLGKTPKSVWKEKFILTLVVLKHMMVSNSGVTVSKQKFIKFQWNFPVVKALTKQFIAVEDIICSKELDVVGELGCSLGQQESMLSSSFHSWNQTICKKEKQQSITKPHLSLVAKSAGVQGSERQREASAGFSSP